MTRLSSPIQDIHSHYDVAVIGSGYGGAIAASRLARAGKRVCVLERGREIQPGQYPTSEAGILKELQMDLMGKHLGSSTAMFDLRFNKDINVAAGCGLGGTSLINAGIALRPDVRIFLDPVWPDEIRQEDALGQYFSRAEDMLKPTTYAHRQPPANKTQAIERSARHLGETSRPAPILVTFDQLPDNRNHVGVEQHPCVHCGDCISGCNYRAKNTLLMNYLPDARNHGAEIFCEVAVRALETGDHGWVVRYRAAGERGTGEERAITAGVVVLAAGTLGSTEILLRSASRGLSLSDALDHRFSGNGDMIGFSYNGDQPIDGVGLGQSAPTSADGTGPCSTTIIDMWSDRPVGEGMMMADGTLPGASAALLPAAFAAGAKLFGERTRRGWRHRAYKEFQELHSKLFGAYRGAVRNTLFFLAITSDDAGGKMYLEDDRIRIDWPGVGSQAPILRAHETLRKATQPLGGTYIPNPVWNRLTDQDLITGHPLGGCAMAGSASDGVVNHKGQVFNASTGTGVHQGLYVVDGASVPRSLGVNPLLAICAIAERCCELMAHDHGWQSPSFG